VGWIDAKANIDNDGNNCTNNNDTDDDDSASIKVAGDIDLKYFFSSGAARPFLQGGFGLVTAKRKQVRWLMAKRSSGV
jgi:hypothetical protein